MSKDRSHTPHPAQVHLVPQEQGSPLVEQVQLVPQSQPMIGKLLIE